LVEKILQDAQNKREWVFIGCGTSFYLAEAAAVSWAMLTGQPARAIPASEVLLSPITGVSRTKIAGGR
jgi:glucosamine--fructose-6-phosphate aminotransferase (isomerizing)